MKFTPEIYTSHLQATKQFYTTVCGFRVKQEIEGFCVLQLAGNESFELMLCEPYSSFVQEIFHPPYAGHGLIFQIDVADLDIEYTRIQRLKTPIALDPIREPVNGYHFAVRDPNGILIDFVEVA